MQEQLDKFQRQQKQTRVKLKFVGPKRLRVDLPDCKKSPSPHPSFSRDMQSCTLMYLDLFCQSLGTEEDLSFNQMLENVDMYQLLLNLESSQIDIVDESPTLWNVGSGQIDIVDECDWDRDATEWLAELIKEMDSQTQLESFENNLNFTDFMEDMTPDEWQNVWDDVLDNFDSNLLP